jgi:hypothetical protein
MAFNIPLPPANFGSGLMEALAQGRATKHNRDQLAQQWKKHLDDVRIAEMQQQRLAEQFEMEKQLHPYKIAAYEQQASLAPFQHQLMQAKIQSALANAQKGTPEYEANRIQALMNAFGGQTGQGGEPLNIPGEQQTNVAPPSMEQVKRGLMKKALGYDIFAPTEEQKRAQKLQDFEDRERKKLEIKGADDYTKPTKAVITTNQNIVNAVNNVVPQIEAIKKLKTPNVITGAFTDPDTNADYQAATDAAADSLMASFKWLGIQASLDMAKNMTKRKFRESEGAYHKRLDSLIKELKMRSKHANDVIKNNKVESHFENEDPLGLRS